MLARLVLAAVALVLAASQACAQAAEASASGGADAAWRRAGEDPSGATGPTTAAPGASPAVAPVTASRGDAGQTGILPAVPAPGDAPRQPIAKVTSGNGTLPNEQGQVWREYDISPYTLRVTTTKRPEQAIVDWILRETGYEVWHSEPTGILSATPRVLRVYHTPEMQAVVADLVDRFVASEAETSAFSLRVITVDHPNWRTRAQRLLRPVSVQTPGVGAWLLSKEDAALLLADLRRRNDFREHSSPHLLVNNGQSTVVSGTRSRHYVRDVLLRANAWPGYEAEPGQIDEGFTLEFSPLLSVDRQMIDAAIRCDIDQVEKMIPVTVDVPSAAAPRQRAQIEVPQISHFRFHERFRWPTGHVLLVGMGMVPVPVPVDSRPLVPGLPLPIGNGPPRADLLVVVEAKGTAGEQAPRVSLDPREQPQSYRGRY